MDTSALKKFAQNARRNLIQTVTNKLKFVLAEGSLPRRESPNAVEDLTKQIRMYGKEAVIEQVAYTWFNRFCALRFMDVNGYNRIRVVSPSEGQTQPEILAEAKMGNIDEMVADERKKQIQGLLNGNISSSDAQGEVYRLLLVSACNDYYQTMPFLFEKIADYTELLLPDDLLSETSILAETREAMTAEICEDVEVIGWLYQYYISEKKDEVFAALKKNKKITPENIPSATQLFTPNWIVRYLVENSLGRLWMLNHPNSRLVEVMDYYISPLSTENNPSPSPLVGENDPSQPPLVGKNDPEVPRSDPPQPPLVRGESKTGGSTSHLKITKPEEIKILDPACGSGHILVYAFDLLYAIYEEQGYQPSEIPEKILTHNLYGIEIDPRAGALSAFALTMKARAKYRRFLRKPVQPNICVLENVKWEGKGVDSKDEGNKQLSLIDSSQSSSKSKNDPSKPPLIRGESKTGVSSMKGEIEEYMDFVGRDLFTVSLQETLRQFEEADNFGSLIRPQVTDVDSIRARLEQVNVAGNLLLYHTHEKVLKVLRQAEFLSPRYHVVIANPPYMGGKGMNPRLSAWVKDNYSDSKSDLFAMFIERGFELIVKHGYSAMVTMQSWMFLSSYEKLRTRLLDQTTIESMMHMANMVMGIAFGTVATIWNKRTPNSNIKGAFCYVEYENIGEGNKPVSFPPINERNKNASSDGFYYVSASDFKKIPGSAIAYWVSPAYYNCWNTKNSVEDLSISDGQNKTGDNDKYLKYFWELSFKRIGKETWIPYAKGGAWRKWYGNIEYFINWYESSRKHYKKDKIARLIPEYLWYRKGITWSFITTKDVGFRFLPEGGTFDVQGSTLFFEVEKDIPNLLSMLNSKSVNKLLKIINPTISLQVKDVRGVPIPDLFDSYRVSQIGSQLIKLSKQDWDSYETSWDFTTLPLLEAESGKWKVESGKEEKDQLHTSYSSLHTYPIPRTIAETYKTLRQQWAEMTLEMQRLEEENNRIFIEAYGLQEELTPEVPLKEITLTCNPHYRYDSSKSDTELEALLLADTMKEFISYGVGCMFGRYSLNKQGLILANQGETIEDYLQQIPHPTYTPTKTNVIPILDGDWFSDDITEQFRQFLRVTFGEANYQTNLEFIEKAIGKKIDKYFQSDFYKDHVKRYKKRPIYWLFSSPKGSFNALIYLHRYRPDTVSIVLNDYLREYRRKLEGQLEHFKQLEVSADVSASQKTKALKDIAKFTKIVNELNEWDRTILYPLAIEKLEIDLDDGVKVNYPKFGKALKEIKGLEAKED